MPDTGNNTENSVPIEVEELNLVRCYHCCNNFHEDETTIFQDQIICNNCHDEETTVCSDCDCRVYTCDSYYLDRYSYRVCDGCIDSYFYCESCNERVNEDDYAGNDYCYDCNDTEREIHSYSYKPTAKFYKVKGETTNEFFGIELEVEFITHESKKYACQELVDYDFLYMKKDGSLSSNGFEIVTHPLSYNWINENKESIIKPILSKLLVNGGKSYMTETAGIHIHLSKSAISTWHLYKLMKFFNDNKKFILVISQRKEENLKRWAKLSDLDKRQRVLKLKRKIYGDRYQAINLLNSKTIEFRIFRGTLKYESFMKNIQFIKSLVEFTRDIKPEDTNLYNYLKYVDNNKKAYRFLFDWLSSKQSILESLSIQSLNQSNLY